ncbi:unnamed protein product [Dracunculus medinensis]|uniref:Polyprenal reductase n=1 Tax=Dracunculus medinensis TaxID=318479 RepID=A0A0N4UK29_DRAME|nr:unnamed protein product [Dracunculus medinensis]
MSIEKFSNWLTIFLLPKRSLNTTNGNHLKGVLPFLANISYYEFIQINQSIPVFIGLLVYLTHLMRRLYETLYISVFSQSSMNILHFMMGIIFYTSSVYSQLLSAFKGSTQTLESLNERNISSFSFITKFQIVLLLIFFLFQYEQNKCCKILSATRKTSNGSIKSYDHFIVKGRLFEYISSPHYSIEILLYCVLMIYYKFTIEITLCCLFVIVNQTIACFLTHRWYKEKFASKYPSKRKAIIPYLL